jgi:hypothetical protein
VVSVTVGWEDASLPQAVGDCARTPSRCQARWGRTVARELAALAGRSVRDPRSLYRLYRRLAAAAPHADVIALGYPRVFPAHPPRRCRPAGTTLTFTRGTMRWINALTARLDATIRRAAAAAHVSYPAASLGALAGHESCTRGTDMGSVLYPNAHGQRALARLVERTLWRRSHAS